MADDSTPADTTPQPSARNSLTENLLDIYLRLPAAARTIASCAIVLGIALCNYFVNRADPPYIFWDENYHITSAQRYLEGIAHFEPHPPLGKMLIAAGEKLSGANAGIDKHILVQGKKIDGERLPAGFSFAGMRLMPALFAGLAALLFFGLMRELTDNRLQALLLSSLYLFENAYVVHFRAAHIDSFQMFFALAALWQFVRAWKKTSPLHTGHYAGLAALCALATMVKVNAAILFLLLPALYIHDVRRNANLRWMELTRDFLSKSAATVAVFALIVSAIFYAHAALTRSMPDPSATAGRQDMAHMSQRYRTFLEQREPLTPPVVFAIARDYWRFMNEDHRAAPKLNTNNPDENGSHPLHWPLHDKTINYRWDSGDGKTSYVQLAGNQASWYLGFLAVVLSMLLIANHRVFGMPLKGTVQTYRLIETFSGLYIAFMLLNLWFITQRVMYLYHYFLGLIFSFVLLALMWKFQSEARNWTKRRQTATLGVGATVILISYLFFLPLSNHWPLTKDQCERRNVFSRIVDCR